MDFGDYRPAAALQNIREVVIEVFSAARHAFIERPVKLVAVTFGRLPHGLAERAGCAFSNPRELAAGFFQHLFRVRLEQRPLRFPRLRVLLQLLGGRMPELRHLCPHLLHVLLRGCGKLVVEEFQKIVRLLLALRFDHVQGIGREFLHISGRLLRGASLMIARGYFELLFKAPGYVSQIIPEAVEGDAGGIAHLPAEIGHLAFQVTFEILDRGLEFPPPRVRRGGHRGDSVCALFGQGLGGLFAGLGRGGFEFGGDAVSLPPNLLEPLPQRLIQGDVEPVQCRANLFVHRL